MGLTQKLEHLWAHPESMWRLTALGTGLAAAKMRGKKNVVFQCDARGHYPYLEPYRRQLEQRDDVELYWTGSAADDDVFSFLGELNIPPQRTIRDIALIRLLPFDVYVSPTSWGNVFPRTPTCDKVQVFHTLADKSVQYGDNLLGFDALFLGGPLHVELLERYVFSKHPEARETLSAYEVGYAKIDALLAEDYDVAAIKTDLGIDPGSRRPVVLYAPNWEKTSALHRYGPSAIEALAKLDVEVLVKLHYMSLFSPTNERATGGVDWRSVLARFQEEGNVRVLGNESIDPYLAAVDVLVTDYGGAALEFICTMKPAVYLDCPDFFAERGFDLIDYRARDTGYIVGSTQELAGAVGAALTEDDEKRKQRRRLRDRLVFNPGCAAEVGTKIIATHLGKLDKRRIASALLDALQRGQP